MKRFFLFILLCFALQSKAQVSEMLKVKQTIIDLFHAMQVSDTTAMRKLFDPSARLQTAFYNKRTLTNQLKTESLDSFLIQIGGLKGDTLRIEERILSYEIRIDEPMASVWAPYDFYLNGRVSHSGVDAFQLFKSADGWHIIQICDTRKKKK